MAAFLMTGATTALLLLLAAALEVGGDAVVRSGLHAGSAGWRLGLIAVGGLVLLAYGLVVNLPPWSFGRLLGVYVAMFFVLAQLVGMAAFGDRPGAGTLAGGALIVAGGIVLTVWR